MIPGIFAVQQFSEGFVWLSLSNEPYAAWNQSASLVFLIFAHILWPIWIPLSVVLLEKNRWRRQILVLLLGVGFMVAMLASYSLLAYPFGSQVEEYHIKYNLNHPAGFAAFIGAAYGFATVFPTFVSTVPKMWAVGLPIAISFVVTKVLFPDYIISIWCFFAAIISIVVIFRLWDMEKDSKIVNQKL